jgi:hypothetical protein
LVTILGIIEGATPLRLLTAFPPDAPVKRCRLSEAIGDIAAFLTETAAKRPPLVERTTPR